MAVKSLVMDETKEHGTVCYRMPLALVRVTVLKSIALVLVHHTHRQSDDGIFICIMLQDGINGLAFFNNSVLCLQMIHCAGEQK